MSCNTLSAFTQNTAKNLQLDAGVLVKNMANPASGDLTNAIYIGATTGGGVFTATPEIRNLFEDIDGARGQYKEGDVIDNWDINFTSTLLEMTADNFALALGACDVTDNTAGGKTITPRLCFEDTDYLDNICWCGTLKGSDKPLVIELNNVLNQTGISFTVTDKGKGSLAVELRPKFTVSDFSLVPFKIHCPKIA